ncbi:MAG: TonB-dependent receptor plug domain-containing protein [Gemmatimonadetes bacterium]|nr:TonB-dependent receptor plug domain-containing protein [Gemmatimonadota bacterium]
MVLVAVAAAVFVPPQPVQGQTLRGTVLDAVTGEPVMLAQVSLLEEGRSEVAADLASLGGAFELEAPGDGVYFLYVRRDGYEALLDGLFELGSDGVVEVRVGLTPEPIELEAVDVVADRTMTPLERSGFYDRVLTAPGHFLSREDIERVGSSKVSDVFQRVPRVEVDATRPLTGPDVMQNPSIFMRRGTEPCFPALYIDRHVVANGLTDAVRPDDWVNTAEIEAIEIYARASQVPPEFDPIGGCGVVLIWTRAR